MTGVLILVIMLLLMAISPSSNGREIMDVPVQTNTSVCKNDDYFCWFKIDGMIKDAEIMQFSLRHYQRNSLVNTQYIVFIIHIHYHTLFML